MTCSVADRSHRGDSLCLVLDLACREFWIPFGVWTSAVDMEYALQFWFAVDTAASFAEALDWI